MKTIVVWLVLIFLTLLSLLFTNVSSLRFVVMGLFAIKFILVAFYFMGISQAHMFWKVFSIILILLISGIIIIV